MLDLHTSSIIFDISLTAALVRLIITLSLLVMKGLLTTSSFGRRGHNLVLFGLCSYAFTLPH